MQTTDIAGTIQQVKQVNEARSQFYRTLASLFYHELSSEQIQALSQASFEGLDGGDLLMRDGYYLIKRAVRKPDGKTRQQLACDYAHTFLAAGNYEERMATPYESVFTSEDGLLMQDARDDVYRMYCQEHVGVSVGYTDPEDHISFEMEFMAALADKCNAALDVDDAAEACRLADVAVDFHTRHLENWIDDLCDAIDKVADTKFYRGVSKLTRGYVHDDKEALADVADALAEIEHVTASADRTDEKVLVEA